MSALTSGILTCPTNHTQSNLKMYMFNYKYLTVHLFDLSMGPVYQTISNYYLNSPTGPRSFQICQCTKSFQFKDSWSLLGACLLQYLAYINVDVSTTIFGIYKYWRSRTAPTNTYIIYFSTIESLHLNNHENIAVFIRSTTWNASDSNQGQVRCLTYMISKKMRYTINTWPFNYQEIHVCFKI